MRRIPLRLSSDERGVAMMVVIAALAMLSALGIGLLQFVSDETVRSSASVRSQTSFQAAEAGIDDYLAKLIDDHLYYAHEVHPGEATRRASTGQEVGAGSIWAYGLTWSYPYPNETGGWRQLSNGYEYRLKITPPTASMDAVGIVAAGRKQGSTALSDKRVIEVRVGQSSIGDFFRVVNGNVGWDSGATTWGKLYANGNISHTGTAHGNIYAEGSITGATNMLDGAQKYDSTTIRSQIQDPISFNSFLASFDDIKRAAQLSSGIYLNTSAPDGWKLVFQNNGTILVYKCTRNGGNLETNNPSCVADSPATRNMPTNGAIYAEKTVIISGEVHGRVTVASNDHIIVGNNVSYVPDDGSNVFGMAAKNNVYAAAYCPTNLTWRGAVLSQSGTWSGAGSTSNHDTMNFTGSASTADGGSWAGMFDIRNYNYDDDLLYLEPPWFPKFGDDYKLLLFRELTAT